MRHCFTTLSVLALLLSLGATGCFDDDLVPSTGYRNEAARAVCEALFEASDAGASGPCTHALAADCEAAVGTLSERFLLAVQDCIESGGDPLRCMSEAGAALEAGHAQHALAASFCDHCALDLPECEQAFFPGDSSLGLGSLFLPLSDEVLHDIRETCAEGLFCAVDFWSCAEERLMKRFTFDEAAICLVFEVIL